MSNFTQSPVFERRSDNHANEQTINFDPQRPVRMLKAYSQKSDSGGSVIRYVRFYGAKSDQIATYNPKRITKICVKVPLENNQELIGVYGSISANLPCFSSFGFIVKINHK